MNDFNGLLLIYVNKWIKMDYDSFHWSAPLQKKKVLDMPLDIIDIILYKMFDLVFQRQKSLTIISVITNE